MRTLAALAMALACAACATAPQVPPAAKSELAPTGKLRVAHAANPALVSRDPATGELRGIVADLARRLAARLGVRFEPVAYPTVAQLLQGAQAGAWDIAFLGYDPARAELIDFAGAYMEVDITALVPARSRITSVADVDRPKVRVAVPAKSAPDLVLSRTLKRARLVRFVGGPGTAFELLRSGQAEAFAENRQTLEPVAAKLPGSRILDGRFFALQQSVAVRAERPNGLAYVREFIEEAKQSGYVQEAIDRSGLAGANVAPLARER